MMSGESNEVPEDDKNQEGGEQPTTTTLTSSSEIITEAKAWSNVAKSFIYVEVSSLVLMFSCIGIWTSNSPYLSYALSVSVVSLGLCLIIQTYEFVKPGILEKIEKPVSLFLFLWWAVGTGVITFKAPFLEVGNGYFSAWAGLAFTTHWALNIDTTKFTELDKCRKCLVLFAMAAAITMFACIPYLHSGSGYVGQSAWGLTAGLITVIVCCVLIYLNDTISAQIMKVTSIILFIIWAAVCGVCTFDGPFLKASNGYFGCWGGFLASTYLLSHIMTREDEIV